MNIILVDSVMLGSVGIVVSGPLIFLYKFKNYYAENVIENIIYKIIVLIYLFAYIKTVPRLLYSIIFTHFIVKNYMWLDNIMKELSLVKFFKDNEGNIADIIEMVRKNIESNLDIRNID